jgi:NAD(P)H-flavin reductase
MLYVFGLGEVPISISGDPGEPERLVHTIRSVGAVTRALQRLQPDDLIGVRGPFGVPWPLGDAAGRDIVIVAGGIGLAPLRPLIYAILRRRQAYGNVVLLYGARTPADLLYARELKKWRARFDIEVEVTVDRASARWQGGVGVVTKLVARSPFESASATAFICGPEVMIRFAATALRERGVAPGQIYLSMERNMHCAVGLCGHCQYGASFVCKDGPVFRYDRILPNFSVREL